MSELPVKTSNENTVDRYQCIGGAMYITREAPNGRTLFVLASDYLREIASLTTRLTQAEADLQEVTCGDVRYTRLGKENERLRTALHGLEREISSRFGADQDMSPELQRVMLPARTVLSGDSPAAPITALSGPPWEFDRYVNGRLKAEGIKINRALTFEQALTAAIDLAGPHDVLVPRQSVVETPPDDTEDMANIGRALMERLPKDYHWNDCPTEIVTDLLNQIHDLRQPPAVETKPNWDGNTCDAWERGAGDASSGKASVFPGPVGTAHGAICEFEREKASVNPCDHRRGIDQNERCVMCGEKIGAENGPANSGKP